MYVNLGTVRALEFLLLRESSFFFVTVEMAWIVKTFLMILMTLLMIILFSCMSSSMSQRVAWLEAHLKANSTRAW